MKYLSPFLLIIYAIGLTSCRTLPKASEAETGVTGAALKLKTGNIGVDFVIHKPRTRFADAFLIFHGTVESDQQSLGAAKKTLAMTRKLVQRDDALYVSVSYPQENHLMGDNFKFAESALLWLKKDAPRALDIEIRKIFLIGHSQGGYLVTRLNTLHNTDGVIANAPGPLNFKLRCELEESKKIPASDYCQKMSARFGSTRVNASAYEQRSLLSHIQNFKSKILFVQGLGDTKLQLTSWPILKSKIAECATCRNAQFVELEGGHAALFENPKGSEIVQKFLD
ncbi:MAG: hypothetical protein RI932_2065 [Pseudomonadota bacterium]|jgi:hypothetical protein